MGQPPPDSHAPASAPSLRRCTGQHALQFTVEASALASEAECTRVTRAIDQYLDQVGSYGRAWDCILPVCHTDPRLGPVSVLAHVLAADFWLSKNDPAAAATSLANAQAVYARHFHMAWSVRDRAYLHALEWRMQGKLREASDALLQMITTFPGDLFAVRTVQLFAFIQGDRPGMLAVLQRADVVAACQQRPFYHGMLAFALEENNRFDEARAAALQGLTLNPRDPSCVHVMAHLFFADGQIDEGIEWLTARTSVTAECMSFFFVHNYFHLALLHLDRDEYAKVADIFDRHIWPFDLAASAASVHSGASSSSASSSAPEAVANDVATSFGVALTAQSFARHDATDAEDQNAALNLLWRLEIRSTCAPSADPSSSQLPREFFTPRWCSLASRLQSPPSQLLSLFGLLQVWSLFRSGQTEQAEVALTTLRSQVSQMTEGDQKTKLEATLLPIAAAIAATHAKDGADSPAQRAFDLLQPVFDPVSAASFAAAAVSSTSASSSPSASPPTPLAPTPHLSCLCASDEQLEVLTEWWLQLCLTAGQTDALTRALQTKHEKRRTVVRWYARLQQASA